MKVLTFVIPAYNSEQFLDKGIPTMLVPEIMDKLEILIVNDGSTDGTPQAAEKYCAQYPDTIRLISQVNKGHGGALNTGCEAAQGKYVKVIDADDWVVTENLPAFIEALKHCESDVVLTHYHTVNISNGEIKAWKSANGGFGQTVTFEQVLDSWREFKWAFTLHGMTYKREFYQQAGYVLPEKVFYEDYDFATYPCCLAKSITPLDLFIYEYRIGDVNQSVSAANQLKRTGHTETVLEDMLTKYRQIPYGKGKDYAAEKIQELFLSYLTTVLLINPNKEEGRKMAAAQREKIRLVAPEIIDKAQKKYQTFTLLNHLHISKATWDSWMSSKIYNRLRKNYSE